VVSYVAVDQALGQPQTPVQYRALRAEEVQCMAAANAALGNLYASESDAVLANPGRCRDQQAAHTLSRLMAFRAADERNKAAGSALQLFYSLAEAEANHDVLDRSIAELDRAMAQLNELKQSGLKMPPDRSALDRQRLDLLDRRIQLQSAIRTMRGQLQQLCGFEADETMPIWPQADLTVVVAPIDAQAAIAEGLANRADLAALQMLSGSLNGDTLPAVRSGMQAMGPGLGASVVARRLLGGDGDLQTRQSQLAQAQAEAERNIRREVVEAVWNAETGLREIAVAKERSAVWQERVAGLRERRQTDGVTAFDLSAAELELLRCESDAVHRVIAWKIAQAKLKQAQGLLAAECGYRVCR
jgi:outer membrane protein TolC